VAGYGATGRVVVSELLQSGDLELLSGGREGDTMINRSAKRKLSFVLAAGMLVVAVFSAAVFSAKKRLPFSAKAQQPVQRHRKDWLFSPPAGLSKVKDLQIINQRIVRADTEDPGVAFEILNKSNRAVMAVRIACGDGRISADGLDDEAQTHVIIEPYGTLTAEMNGELDPGHPMVITAATFQDGKEEGDDDSVKFMQRIRLRERARHKAQRAQESTRLSQ
jgi:hypothetical protein